MTCLLTQLWFASHHLVLQSYSRGRIGNFVFGVLNRHSSATSVTWYLFFPWRGQPAGAFHFGLSENPSLSNVSQVLIGVCFFAADLASRALVKLGSVSQISQAFAAPPSWSQQHVRKAPMGSFTRLSYLIIVPVPCLSFLSSSRTHRCALVSGSRVYMLFSVMILLQPLGKGSPRFQESRGYHLTSSQQRQEVPVCFQHCLIFRVLSHVCTLLGGSIPYLTNCWLVGSMEIYGKRTLMGRTFSFPLVVF